MDRPPIKRYPGRDGVSSGRYWMASDEINELRRSVVESDPMIESPSRLKMTPRCAWQSLAALSMRLSSTVCRSKLERLMALSTSTVAACCWNASVSCRRSCASSVSGELRPRTVGVLPRFGVSDRRRRRSAALPLALERRRIASPKAQGYVDFAFAITAGIYGQRNGVERPICAAKILNCPCLLWATNGHDPMSASRPFHPS